MCSGADTGVTMTRRSIALCALFAASFAPACAATTNTPKTAESSGEWVSGPTDLRKMTAIVRAMPPARLKAAFETVAARSEDPDFADHLRAHASGGFGSGFLVIHKSGQGTKPFIVTNRHVVAESENVEVTFGDGTTYKECEIVYSSKKYDLAVVALPDSATRAFGHGFRVATRDPSDRLPIVAAGYPGVGGKPSYQVTDGKISNATFKDSQLGDETFIQHTAPIDPGSSGGPLTDEAGAIVGVNVMMIRQRSSMFFAVPAAAVTETVRYAHELTTQRQSTAWMTKELDAACSSLAAELGSMGRTGSKLAPFVSNKIIAERGLESYALLNRTSLADDLRQIFFVDPIIAMRTSVLVRLNARAEAGGGSAGTCTSINPGDATAIAEGKPVRLGVKTKSGGAMELAWTFEHGSWRVANGELIELHAAAEEPAPPPPPAASKKFASKKTGGK